LLHVWGDSLPLLVAKLTDSLQATLQTGARRLRRRLNLSSDYDSTIPPEIFGDEFYEVIRSLASEAPIKTALEIGSSNGEGSTSAFVDGLRNNPNFPMLFCMEVSRPRFQELDRRFGSDPQVKCYNVTSVPLDRFPTEDDVTEFYRSRQSKLNRVPLREVLRWLRQDLRYISGLGPTQNGIRMIKEENAVDRFGMVLIDGSEFTGPAELDEVYGADYILLDDIGTYKNHANHERLSNDSAYRLRTSNAELRNGYSVFERCSD
jgi:hypothetical protein